MKKTILFIMAFLPIFAHAENMCVKNGSIMVVLDPQIKGTALSNNATGKTWSTQFPYGIISGIGGCISKIASSVGAVGDNSVQTSVTPYTTGERCWCKILRPVESLWIYTHPTSASSSTCATNCASYCASVSASTVALRAGLFGNVIE